MDNPRSLQMDKHKVHTQGYLLVIIQSISSISIIVLLVTAHLNTWPCQCSANKCVLVKPKKPKSWRDITILYHYRTYTCQVTN